MINVQTEIFLLPGFIFFLLKLNVFLLLHMLVVSSLGTSILTYLCAFSGFMLLCTEIPLTFSLCYWHLTLALTLTCLCTFKQLHKARLQEPKWGRQPLGAQWDGKEGSWETLERSSEWEQPYQGEEKQPWLHRQPSMLPRAWEKRSRRAAHHRDGEGESQKVILRIQWLLAGRKSELSI